MDRLPRAIAITRLGRRLKMPLKRALANMGYELVPLHGEQNRVVLDLARRQRVDTVIDIGANQGQYAQKLRALGFDGRMVSFEPMREAFDILEKASAADSNWTARRRALGDHSGIAELYVAGNSVSSSLLPVSATHVDADETSRTVRTETVTLNTLDDELSNEEPARRYWLKLDVQGYEVAVLDGASSTLQRTRVVQCELSTRVLYTGQSSYLEVLHRLEEAGFTPVHLIPGFSDPRTGEMLQADIVAARMSDSENAGPTSG